MTPTDLELATETLGCLPVINWFLHRIGVDDILERYLPDAGLRIAPAVVAGVVIRNLIVNHRPVYALTEWAGPYRPSLLGLEPGDIAALNDDRTARTLDRLFDTDRATLITAIVLHAVREFNIELTQLHNDSTTVTFSGAYTDAAGTTRGGKPTPAIVHGHNKDHRPDLKQLLFVLTVSADGAVPIAFRTENGNTNDDVTHIPTWDQLHALVGRPDFLYVADSKLANRAAMDHIAKHGGRFVTVMPRTRKEDSQFRDWLVTHQPDWSEAHRKPANRQGDPDAIWHTTPSPSPTTEGYRIVWVRSSTKIDRDAEARRARIGKGIAALDDLNTRLASTKCRIKTAVAAENEATAALKAANATRWIDFTIQETTTETVRQERRGRPGPDTRYRKIIRTHHHIGWTVNEELVGHDAASDGVFPLITNDVALTDAEVLAAYRYQPNLERRNHILKGPQHVAPVHLERPERIEALMLCHFLAMLTEALIEREIRTSMKTRGLDGIPLYPELRKCPAPAAPRILEIFNNVQRHHLTHQGHTIKTFEPELTPLHHQILELLNIPATTYTNTTPPHGGS